jgi:hypothetical protein
MPRGIGNLAVPSTGLAVGFNVSDYVRLSPLTLVDWITFEVVMQMRDTGVRVCSIQNTSGITIFEMSLGLTTVDSTGRPCIVMTTPFTTQNLTYQLPFDLHPGFSRSAPESAAEFHHFLISHKIDLTFNTASFGWHNGEMMAGGIGQGAVGTASAAGDYVVNNTFPSYIGNNTALNNPLQGLIDRFRVFNCRLTDDVALKWSRGRDLHCHDENLIWDYPMGAEDSIGFDMGAIGGPVPVTVSGTQLWDIEGRTTERGGGFESASKGIPLFHRRAFRRRAGLI